MRPGTGPSSHEVGYGEEFAQQKTRWKFVSAAQTTTGFGRNSIRTDRPIRRSCRS